MKNLKDILILDIETVSGKKNFDELPEDLQYHWERKSGFLRNYEDTPPAQTYLERAAIYAEFGKVVVIAVGIFVQIDDGHTGLRVRSFHGHDEKELLTSFSQFLSTKFDPQRLALCAHNGKEFDFPYLCRRLLVNGIRIPDVLDLSGKKPWEVQHIDTMELWKFGDRKNFTSLDLLTSIFGITSSKGDMDGSMVNDVYYKEMDLERIGQYCKNDVIATAQLLLKMNAMETIPQDQITILD